MKKLALILMMSQMVLYAAGPAFYSLYTDRKGKKVGDVITVLINEQAKANKGTSTETDHDQSMGASFSDPTGVFSKIPGWDAVMGLNLGTEQDFKGKGKTSRNGSLVATVSATIVEVFANGNLLIQATKEVTVNDETEILELVGTIRPEDISSNNAILSSRIADANIKYSGEGALAEVDDPGFVTRFFNWLF
jgi:flagellar L-ring protein precursor FlgH